METSDLRLTCENCGHHRHDDEAACLSEQKVMMVSVYYETDFDSGWYNVALFTTNASGTPAYAQIKELKGVPMMTDDQTAAVFAEMKHLAIEGCTGEHDGTCSDEELEVHPEDWCKRCLMGAAVQFYEQYASLLAAATAERDALREELAKWKICENCGEPLAGPGICDKAISDKEKGLEQMWEDTLTRAETAERELIEARAEIARLHELLAETGWTKEPR
jgi:hypothetical protein